MSSAASNRTKFIFVVSAFPNISTRKPGEKRRTQRLKVGFHFCLSRNIKEMGVSDGTGREYV